MVAALTTDDLLNEVKDQAMVPSTEGRLTDLQILKLASEVMRTEVAELMVGSRSQRWNTAVTMATIAGTSTYPVPERALATGVSEILISDGATGLWNPPEISQPDVWRYVNSHGGWDSPYAYAWSDEGIMLLPTPADTTYSILWLYPRGLLRLVRVSDAGRITAVGASTVTISATPSAWTSSEVVDIVSGRPSGAVRAIDVSASISGTTVTIGSSVSDCRVGDYVCLDGETCIPPVPDVVWPVLVSGTAREVGIALADGPLEQQLADRRASRAASSAKALLTPRSRGASKKIVTRGYGSRRGMR